MVFSAFSQKLKAWNYAGDPFYCEISSITVSPLLLFFCLFSFNPLCVFSIFSFFSPFFQSLFTTTEETARKREGLRVESRSYGMKWRVSSIRRKRTRKNNSRRWTTTGRKIRRRTIEERQGRGSRWRRTCSRTRSYGRSRMIKTSSSKRSRSRRRTRRRTRTNARRVRSRRTRISTRTRRRTSSRRKRMSRSRSRKRKLSWWKCMQMQRSLAPSILTTFFTYFILNKGCLYASTAAAAIQTAGTGHDQKRCDHPRKRGKRENVGAKLTRLRPKAVPLPSLLLAWEPFHQQHCLVLKRS